jgi:Domain of unknown function (DUF5667)
MPESASERFARAVEGGPIEPDLDESLRHELALVEALRYVGGSVRLDDAVRLRIREELQARLASQPETADEAVDPRPETADEAVDPRLGSADGAIDPRPGSVPQPKPLARSRRAGVRGLLLVAAAAALCLLLSLSAMSLLMARDALPGDALYGVKRSAESAELGFTFGAESRGFKHLQFATARLDELEAMAAGGVGPTTDAGPYREAIEEFDADAAAGSRLLIEAATKGNSSLLSALHSWAEQQSPRIQMAVPALPEQAAIRAAESGELLRRIAERAASLRARVGCLAVTSGGVDDIGPLPAEGPCQPVNTAPAGSRSASPDDPNRRPGDQPATSAPPSGTGSQPSEQAPSNQPDPSLPGAADSPPESVQTSLPLLPPVPPLPSTQPTQPTLPLLPGLPGVPLG